MLIYNKGFISRLKKTNVLQQMFQYDLPVLFFKYPCTNENRGMEEGSILSPEQINRASALPPMPSW